MLAYIIKHLYNKYIKTNKVLQMSENKTKDYVLRANRNYRKNLLIKTVYLHKTDDEALIECINQDNVSFNQRIKELLKIFYGIKSSGE